MKWTKDKWSWSLGAILILSVVCIITMFNLKKWNNSSQHGNVIEADVVAYYTYLPAAFVKKDLTFSFLDRGETSEEDLYWVLENEEGEKVVKMSMGMSLMYAPFFGMAHGYASSSSQYKADGFSTPYEFFINLSSVFYFILGLIFFSKLLRRFYSDRLTALMLLIVVLGTNLFYYTTTEPAMSHAYSFALIAAFLHHGFNWLGHQKLKHAIYIGLLGGLIILIRPVNILVFLIPLLYGVFNGDTIRERVSLLRKKWKHLLIIIGGVFLVWIPQLIYWKLVTGSWLYFSYQGEAFYFTDPKILEGFFSFRKGWLLYTPIMFFAIIGIGLLYKHKRSFFWPVMIFFVLNSYVMFSWWCWWYGGSFGMRPMVDSYALMAIPLAEFILLIGRSNLMPKILGITAVVFLVALNLIQTQQKRLNIIHWDGMNKEAYLYGFLSLSTDKLEEINKLITPPDYNKAKRGEKEYHFDPTK